MLKSVQVLKSEGCLKTGAYGMLCVFVVCRGLWKAVWWVVLGVHVDLHGEWVMLWLAAM